MRLQYPLLRRKWGRMYIPPFCAPPFLRGKSALWSEPRVFLSVFLYRPATHFRQPQAQEAQNEVVILYHFPALRYWVSAEQKIKNISAVNNINVQAMTPGKAQFKISYTGNLDTLKAQFKAIGYNLDEADTHMILRNIGE